MPRVVPSQVVFFIDRTWPGGLIPSNPIASPSLTKVSSLVELVERIPDQLLLMGPDLYMAFLSSLAVLRAAVVAWQAGVNHLVTTAPAFPDFHVVTTLRNALAACPDEAPSPQTTALPFIGDAGLRESIRLDISAAYRNLADGEWKGATVLAGSGIEALLLWAIQDQEQKKLGTIAAALAALVPKPLAKNPGSDPEGAGWHLHEHVEVAEHLKIIRADTATLVRLAKDFRNLIHPGRAARLGQKCDHSTALSALAAVEAVARDLS